MLKLVYYKDMLEKSLSLFRKMIPKKLFKMVQPVYHFILALVGMVLYNFPAKDIKVIAVTGTKGKTSTANFIYSVLSESGHKVGLISTANIRIGEKEFPNKYHMSMPGRFILQKLLSQMKKENCKYVVLEASSEGIKQFRHIGLFIDISVFTNLSPEHLSSHGGSFDKYRSTKLKIFSKNIFNKLRLVLINKDDNNSNFFLEKAKNINTKTFSMSEVKDILEREGGLSFNFKEEEYEINILGRFNIYNALPAIILGEEFKISQEKIKLGLKKLNLIPGRMESLNLGQNFRVIIDYAHEKLSMNSLLDTAKSLKKNSDNKIIIVLGGDGGGRDEQRLFDMGEAVGRKADLVIVSNSDPYFDDELTLSEKIANQAEKFGKIKNQDLFIILDRQEAIKRALSLAKEGDIVLLTTRGSLNTMSVKGKSIPSDDKAIAKKEIQDLLNNKK